MIGSKIIDLSDRFWKILGYSTLLGKSPKRYSIAAQCLKGSAGRETL